MGQGEAPITVVELKAKFVFIFFRHQISLLFYLSSQQVLVVHVVM